MTDAKNDPETGEPVTATETSEDAAAEGGEREVYFDEHRVARFRDSK